MENIWNSLSRKITGVFTDEDQKNISEWLSIDSKNQKIYSHLNEVWNSDTNINQKLPLLFKYTNSRIKKYQSKHSIQPLIIRFSKIAAVIILVLSTGFFAMNYFNLNEKQANTTVAYTTIHVPKGNRVQLYLPDSTKVWLNNGSKIIYPSVFSKNTRFVDLEGEAFFEVKENHKVPFFVNMGKNRIKVTGTKFSVSAYPDDNFIETSLLSGSVEFETLTNNKSVSYSLDPGYSIKYVKGSGKIFKHIVNPLYYNYWIDGIYEFKEESLESLAKKIDRIYNTTIIFENESLKHLLYTGTLSINDNIFTFMEAVKRTSVESVEYHYSENKIYLKLKK